MKTSEHLSHGKDSVGPSMGSLTPPPATSSLASWATDDFSSADWVPLHSERTTHSAAAFWHVMKTFTDDRHWNRTIFSLSPQTHELVPLTSTSLAPSDTTPDVDTNTPYKDPSGPSPGFRYNALRLLARKSPSPIGGSENDPRCFHAHEWTAQWTDDDSEKHIAVFGLCIPSAVVTEDNPRARSYWPF